MLSNNLYPCLYLGKNNQAEIELLEIDNITNTEEEWEKFENEYFTIRSQIQELINTEKLANGTGLNVSFCTWQSHHAYETDAYFPFWLRWKHSGMVVILWLFSWYGAWRWFALNSTKIILLTLYLSGPALDLTRSIPISDGNCVVVLEYRYDNKSLIVI